MPLRGMDMSRPVLWGSTNDPRYIPASRLISYMASGGDDEEWLRASPPPTVAAPSRRRNKLLRLDDLLVDNHKEKTEKLEREAKKFQSQKVDSSDDDESTEDAKDGIVEFIQMCANEVGDGSDMKEAPKWGEKVFGAQKEGPLCPLNSIEGDVLKRLLVAAKALSSRASLMPERNDEEALMLELLTGNWILPLVYGCGRFDPAIRHWVFNKMAYSKNRNVEQAACKVLCESQHDSDSNAWSPKSVDFLEALRSYGYLDISSVTQALNAADLEGHGPPSNLASLLKFLYCCCQNRRLQIFSVLEAQDLLRVLARCLLDRHLLPVSCLIQECMRALTDYFTDEEWDVCFQRIAVSLARVSKDIVNVLYITKMLRGTQKRIQSLQREISFDLLSSMMNKKLNWSATDIVSGLEAIDPRVASVDFVQLHHHLVLADMWLRHDSSFGSGDPAFSSWMSILRGLSVRISCGDYRTFATKVRNRAAFLASIYLNLKAS